MSCPHLEPLRNTSVMSTWEKVVVLNLSPEQSCVSVNRSKSESGILTKAKDRKHVREDEDNLQGQEREERGSQ